MTSLFTPGILLGDLVVRDDSNLGCSFRRSADKSRVCYINGLATVELRDWLTEKIKNDSRRIRSLDRLVKNLLGRLIR